MSEDAGEISKLKERLSATGSKLADISKMAAEATKTAALKTAELSKGAAQSASVAGKKAANRTNDAVKKVVSDSKTRIEDKREKKSQKARDELSNEPLLDDIPPMVTLPEFEVQRMGVVNEQQKNQLLLLEEMQRISSRLDTLEKRNRTIAKNTVEDYSQNTAELNIEEKKAKPNVIGTSAAMGEMLHILGASLVWLVALVGLDQYTTEKELMLSPAYPADLLLWSIGSFTWVMYLLFRLGKSGIRMPLLIRVQASLAVGITTLMGLMMNDDSMSTVSSVWTWGTILAIALLLGSSMLATAWRTTKSLVGIRETIEIIE